MSESLPSFPAWLVALFGALIVFATDIVKGGYKQPMVWVSVALGQVVCLWLSFDLFAQAKLVPHSVVGVVLSGLLLSALASKAIYPTSSALLEAARSLRLINSYVSEVKE